MSVLVDTGVLYAYHDGDTARHAAARAAIRSLASGTMGQPYVSDYIFDEAVTLTRAKTGAFAAAASMADRIRGIDPFPELYRMLYMTRDVFERSIETLEHYDDQSLSFTDATSIAFVERHDLDGIVSFDDDFDGLVHRVDPATL